MIQWNNNSASRSTVIACRSNAQKHVPRKLRLCLIADGGVRVLSDRAFLRSSPIGEPNPRIIILPAPRQCKNPREGYGGHT
ncbi:hypothetical protein EVAR_20160_1 [Eumeta japonica]|uniref:Uncharacterized protein n=1 Tax=Eumeta variegata TaxID=151549 RepID=A0A4C1UTN8_EUMVA|nr:hypothetical protein EVAR_20160_1 [Eumeta japonica]